MNNDDLGTGAGIKPVQDEVSTNISVEEEARAEEAFIDDAEDKVFNPFVKEELDVAEDEILTEADMQIPGAVGSGNLETIIPADPINNESTLVAERDEINNVNMQDLQSDIDQVEDPLASKEIVSEEEPIKVNIGETMQPEDTKENGDVASQMDDLLNGGVVENTTLPQPADIEVQIPDNLYLSRNVKADMHDDDKLAQEILDGRPFWDLGQVEFLLDPLARKTAQLSLVDLNDPKEDYVAQKRQLAVLPELNNIAENFDLPLIPVLYKMERAGVKIDPERFEVLHEEFTAETAALEQDIYQLAGQSFNINSPIQLSDILFNVLELPTKGIKKTQRAYSTGAKELDKLRNLHPIISKIERYREVNKLLTTYVAPFPNLADRDLRIHTTYTQDVTATGRLSSINPNLQNIPVRSDDGKRIRNCFVAEKGKIFVSADYAQFELRLAAALAGDQALIDDFNAGLDIHTKTAADAFHIPMEQVTKNQRRAAKVINFGVLYGMSPKGLADAADMSFYEAKKFIENYFDLRAPIRKYLDKTLEDGRTKGYVQTLFGRRRPTPDLHAPNYVVRTAAERAAGNMPIQGTEADLMKKAMLAVDKALPDGAQIILQIHDSLIVECDEALKDQVAEILKTQMESVAPELPVKLAVDATTGHDWGEL